MNESMHESASRVVRKAAQALLDSVQTPGSNIAECLNLSLNQFLKWPFKVDAVCIVDTDGKSSKCDTVIYATSESQAKHYPVEVKSDAVACGMHIVRSLGLEEIREGYERIADVKRMNKTRILGIKSPINTATLGIIFAVDSDIPIEKIAEHMIQLNKRYSFSEWPDMVVILTRGTINYSAQLLGASTTGDIIFPNSADFHVVPMYVHLVAHSLELFSLNKMFSFLFGHLLTFSPGTELMNREEVLIDVPPYGIKLGAYEFNLSHQLVPVTEEQYLRQISLH
jgi:hypothetical protein